jgi:CRP-like cAMP-binding protein
MTWQWEKLNDCVERRFFSGERLTVAQFRLKAGCVVQRHSHPQEQIAIVLEGLLEVHGGCRRRGAHTAGRRAFGRRRYRRRGGGRLLAA